jgi:hypothetical protein
MATEIPLWHMIATSLSTSGVNQKLKTKNLAQDIVGF